mmetsp:Transcript_19177/g.64248  ORF Transcript_19177/g.64248 Transcript_19177/m.64248 type:complete len:247 (+) Transcript_19177:118-858(+)
MHPLLPVLALCALDRSALLHGRPARAAVQLMAKRKKAQAAKAVPAWAAGMAPTESALLDAVREQKRDMKAITGLIDTLVDSTGGKAVPAEALHGSWQLLWVPTAASLDRVGTGLHNVPGTTFEDFFLTVGREKACKCEANEVLRVFGPFPNVRNVLEGTYAYEAPRLRLVYTSMVDGLGKTIEPKGGDGQGGNRVVDLRVRYAGPSALIASSGEDVLVFGACKSVREELVRLRVLKPKDEESAEGS